VQISTMSGISTTNSRIWFI